MTMSRFAILLIAACLIIGAVAFAPRRMGVMRNTAVNDFSIKDFFIPKKLTPAAKKATPAAKKTTPTPASKSVSKSAPVVSKDGVKEGFIRSGRPDPSPELVVDETADFWYFLKNKNKK